MSSGIGPFGIELLSTLRTRLDDGQDNNSIPDTLGTSLTLDTYAQIIKPFIHTKSAPDNLASEIRTKANTEAIIMVLNNKSGVIEHITNKFFLSSMQISMREKFQLMETFGASNISFFGEAARIYSFTASTVDSASQDSGVSQGKYFYQSSILKMYNNVLRGTQLIKENKIAVIKTNNHLIYGYPLNMQVTYNASQDPVTNFTLQFVVAEHNLEMPGVVTESYLEDMYDPSAHINSEAIEAFFNKIMSLIKKINIVLDLKIDGESYGYGGYIGNIPSRAGSGQYSNHPPSMKIAYTSALSAAMGALKAEFAKAGDGQISPLVHSKVPDNILDRLLALIPSMFKDQETFNLIATNFNNLIQLKKELNIFLIFRLNRSRE